MSASGMRFIAGSAGELSPGMRGKPAPAGADIGSM
jgi:hypothetical protein